MDPVGLLAALVAVAAFPGGAYAVVAAGAAALTPPWRALDGWTATAAAGAACTLVAAAQLPLPGSPAVALPDHGGAPANLLALLLLLAAAAALLNADDPWPPTRIAAAAVATLPLLWLAAVTAGFAPAAIIELPGGDELAAGRVCAGLALLVAAPAVLPLRAGTPRAGRALLLAVAALLALLLLEPVRLRSQPGVLTDGLALPAIALWAALDRLAGERPVLRASIGAALAVASVSLAALAVR